MFAGTYTNVHMYADPSYKYKRGLPRRYVDPDSFDGLFNIILARVTMGRPLGSPDKPVGDIPVLDHIVCIYPPIYTFKQTNGRQQMFELVAYIYILYTHTEFNSLSLPHH